MRLRLLLSCLIPLLNDVDRSDTGPAGVVRCRVHAEVAEYRSIGCNVTQGSRLKPAKCFVGLFSISTLEQS